MKRFCNFAVTCSSNRKRVRTVTGHGHTRHKCSSTKASTRDRVFGVCVLLEPKGTDKEKDGERNEEQQNKTKKTGNKFTGIA